MRQILVVVAVLSFMGCQSRSISGPSAPTAVVSPEVVRPSTQPTALERFTKDFQKAVQRAFGATTDDIHNLVPSAVAPRDTVILATVAPSLHPAGVIIAPLPQANQIAVPDTANSARVTLTIDLADKLAVGNTIAWDILFSTDNGATWARAAGATWVSYGPLGFHAFNLATGEPIDNPDIPLQVSLNNRRGALIRTTVTTNLPMTFGMAISVT